jgi:beta-N-acetylhexosaminidase
MLRGLDVLLFDLQDVGTRVYTFVWTMVLAISGVEAELAEFSTRVRPYLLYPE